MFASRTPRDLNHDHMPWADPCGWRSSSGHIGVKTYAPRPEFDHAQHNPPNPVLVALRRYVRVTGEALKEVRTVLYALDAGILNWGATDDQIDHARKVLTRLANLTKRVTL